MSDKSKTILHEGNFLRFVNRDGWEFVERNNCSGIVIIVPLTDDDRIIFVEQYRPPLNKRVIEFPAGLVNDGKSKDDETLESAAIRELFEETGYTAERVEKLITGPVSGGSSADLVTMFRAFGLRKTGSGGGDDTEEIKVHEVALSSVENWLRQKEEEGFLIEPKIFSGLYFLKSE